MAEHVFVHVRLEVYSRRIAVDDTHPLPKPLVIQKAIPTAAYPARPGERLGVVEEAEDMESNLRG